MSDKALEIGITVLVTLLASSGFWAYIMSIRNTKSASNQLLIGIAHDRIRTLGREYIDRGWVSPDEHENLYEYLYVPYTNMGGNGSATRIIKEVDTLPLKDKNI